MGGLILHRTSEGWMKSAYDAPVDDINTRHVAEKLFVAGASLVDFTWSAYGGRDHGITATLPGGKVISATWFSGCDIRDVIADLETRVKDAVSEAEIERLERAAVAQSTHSEHV